jgi:2-amino-4-hydroxy-6-hydroxymethyldihydropteridine diphosphokinase
MTSLEHQVCLLLGSNIQPDKNIVLGVDMLRLKGEITRISLVWETPSMGAAGPNFLNLAVWMTTPLEADELKEKVLRPLETQIGRVCSADKNAPRPIDFDIIIFDGQLLDPDLWHYAHKAVPVAEIYPDYRSDQGEILSNVASQLAQATPIRLKPDVLIDHRMN